ncbi:hypothetical protein KC980_04400, partial [candidate division WWE3 bacterium]|nr:hypothetical protein [candidate division WWE3 bacterium]
LIDSIMQGGNSGSIVFDESGELVGVLYGGLNDMNTMKIGELKIPYPVPTNLSYAVPCQLINEIINKMLNDDFYKSHKIDTKDFNKYLEETEPTVLEPKMPNKNMKEITNDDILKLEFN